MKALIDKLVGSADGRPLDEIIKENVYFVDVRSPEEFASGSVDGAVNIPLGALPQQVSAFENRRHIVVFCRSGARSGQAKMLLEREGIQNVVNGGPWQQVQAALDRVMVK